MLGGGLHKIHLWYSFGVHENCTTFLYCMKNLISVQKFKNHLKANNFTTLKMHEMLMYGQQQ